MIRPVVRVIFVERLPDGKLPVDITVMHEEDGVKSSNRDFSPVTHVFVESAGLVVHVIVDELQVEIPCKVVCLPEMFWFVDGHPSGSKLGEGFDVLGLKQTIHHLGQGDSVCRLLVPLVGFEGPADLVVVDGAVHPDLRNGSSLRFESCLAGYAAGFGVLTYNIS